MNAADQPISSGISLELARERSSRIRNVRYSLAFSIPDSLAQPVHGRAVIRFEITNADDDLILDFDSGQGDGPIRIPKTDLVVGENSFEFAFQPQNGPLNRSQDFLYTLFVPARAHHVFPCFDQPDLKARFQLSLELPPGWTFITNSDTETEPIPTYLFAFAAGKFREESAKRNGRRLRMLHRETDEGKLTRNRDAIFDLHAKSCQWLEEYTGIPYPFSKFDFVLIPSFQFSGMEHPGSIYYNAAALLLDESATEKQVLNRAALIAHETAHIWFGDLTTIRWFDDVWLKEVFANLMSDKILETLFPQLDHATRFVIAHYPPANAIDRTPGAHPIRQPLNDLSDAASLYGATIYHKAPIVLGQLERQMQSIPFQSAVRGYLHQYKFDNANWPDLVRHFDANTSIDIVEWSRRWIESSGKALIDSDAKAAEWIVRWEETLDGAISPADFLDEALRSIDTESPEQLTELILGYASELFWKFLSEDSRNLKAPTLEECLRRGMNRGPVATYFSALRAIVSTEEGIDWLERVWRRVETVPGLTLGEYDETSIAFELAVRRREYSSPILDIQRARISNPDRRTRFMFVERAVSPDENIRDAFFDGLRTVEQRQREPWVLDGLRLLNHPLHARSALKYIRPALELLPEIRATGDIFFPKNWTDALLSGHNSSEAALILETFLAERPNLKPELRRIVLQSSDSLCRAVRLLRTNPTRGKGKA